MTKWERIEAKRRTAIAGEKALEKLEREARHERVIAAMEQQASAIAELAATAKVLAAVFNGAVGELKKTVKKAATRSLPARLPPRLRMRRDTKGGRRP